MRQCYSQSLHSSTVIARQQQTVAGRQKSEISTRRQAPAQLNSTHGRSFATIISWWNHAWNKIILGRSNDGGCSVWVTVRMSIPNSHQLYRLSHVNNLIATTTTTMCRSVTEQSLLNSAHTCLNTITLCQHRSPVTRYATWRHARWTICILNIRHVGRWWCATFNVLSMLSIRQRNSVGNSIIVDA